MQKLFNIKTDYLSAKFTHTYIFYNKSSFSSISGGEFFLIFHGKRENFLNRCIIRGYICLFLFALVLEKIGGWCYNIYNIDFAEGVFIFRETLLSKKVAYFLSGFFPYTE